MERAARELGGGGRRRVAALAALLAALGPASALGDGARFTVSADTALDQRTGLVWQRVAPAQTRTWREALAYCEGLTLGGASDWRLPSRKELHSLVDVRAARPSLDATVFPGTPAGYFWSSSPFARDPSFAWGIDFHFVHAYTILWLPSGTAQWVRCVR